MRFRYDIGALRALAVLIVVFFHFQVPFFDGGFIGVDIFFVISGYLMTRIVLEGFEKAKFSLLDLYRRLFSRVTFNLIVFLKSNLGEEDSDIVLHSNIRHHDVIYSVLYMLDDDHLSVLVADQLVVNLTSSETLDRDNYYKFVK